MHASNITSPFDVTDRVWTLADSVPQRWQPDAAPLPSDSRYREDLAALAAGDLAGAQEWKGVLEERQRADKRARAAAGVREHE
jgi:Oxysterol-binding protein